MLTVTRSLVAPDALARTLAASYGLSVTDCVLLRSLVNDVYRVDTKGDSFVLKLYRHGRWSREEVAWEIDLVNTLADHDLEVAAVVPQRDGSGLAVLPMPEGERAAVLSTYTAHDKPRPPFDAALYREFGALIARFHHAAARVPDRHPRPFVDVERALEEPLRQVLPALADRPERQRYLTELGKRAAAEITRLRDGLTTGVCHSDVTLDNVWISDQGLLLHDFDSACYGWRVHDLTGVAATPYLEAFLRGYRRHASFTAADAEALPWFRIAATIGNLRFHLVDKPRFAGIGESEWVDRELTALGELGAAVGMAE